MILVIVSDEGCWDSVYATEVRTTGVLPEQLEKFLINCRMLRRTEVAVQ